MRTGVAGWKYKPDSLYEGSKILIRQAGVGLTATYDVTSARCPQSIYIYRLKPEDIDTGYKHEYILAALLSRTMAYYIFKRFGEVDPAKAHAKLTHKRLSGLPIPNVDFSNKIAAKSFHTIVESSKALLQGQASIGGDEDLKIEWELRKLWGLSSDEGAYINGEFADLPASQNLRDLFPNGIPNVTHLS